MNPLCPPPISSTEFKVSVPSTVFQVSPSIIPPSSALLFYPSPSFRIGRSSAVLTWRPFALPLLCRRKDIIQLPFR